MIKWGEKDMTSLTESHLKNIIKWINREKLSADMLALVAKHYEQNYCYLYTAFWNAYKAAAHKIANDPNADLTLEANIIEGFKRTDERQFRKGNWQTREEFLKGSEYDSDGVHILEKHHGSAVFPEEDYDPWEEDISYHDYKRSQGE